MKNRILTPYFFLTMIFVLLSCSKDDDIAIVEEIENFETLNFEDINAVESRMSDALLNASNDSGLLWEEGKIILYKTSENRFGKFKVLNIDIDDNYLLTIEAITYADDGSIYNADPFIEIPGTFSLDLDEFAINTDSAEYDFFWQRVTATQTSITSRNGFIFIEYDEIIE